MPETKDRTIEEVMNEFQNSGKEHSFATYINPKYNIYF